MLIEHHIFQRPFLSDSPKQGIFSDAEEAFGCDFPAAWFGCAIPHRTEEGSPPTLLHSPGATKSQGNVMPWCGTALTCIGRLLAMVKLGMGGSALYVFVSAVSVLPNMEPDVKEETIIE